MFVCYWFGSEFHTIDHSPCNRHIIIAHSLPIQPLRNRKRTATFFMTIAMNERERQNNSNKSESEGLNNVVLCSAVADAMVFFILIHVSVFIRLYMCMFFVVAVAIFASLLASFSHFLRRLSNDDDDDNEIRFVISFSSCNGKTDIHFYCFVLVLNMNPCKFCVRCVPP